MRSGILLILLLIPAVVLCNANPGLSILSGKFNAAENSDFTEVSRAYGVRKGLFLQKEALAAFKAMAKDARADGIDLYILSATRSFWQQKSIWEAKYNGERLVDGKKLNKSMPDGRQRSLKILHYSSMPGTSRHHWGTDVDISFSSDYDSSMLSNEKYDKGQGLRVYTWLKTNAAKYGFCQPYKGHPAQRNEGKYELGYLEEKWHWSFFPIAKTYAKYYLENSSKLIPQGFDGSEFGKEFYMQFVLNVSPDCQ